MKINNPPILNKKYLHEEEAIKFEGNDSNSKYGLNIDTKINKSYKFNLNTDEELSFMLKNKNNSNKESNLHIHDLRFFDVSHSSDKNIVFIYHKNPNPKLIRILNEIKSVIITKENLFEQININNENLSKYEEINLAYAEGLKECLKHIITTDNNLLNNMPSKIIFYIDYEQSDIIFFEILIFMTKISKLNSEIELIILTDDSVIFPLKLGMNYVYLSNCLFTRKGVGLLPMEKSIISTKGFEWDVENWETSFGHLNLSTSNEIKDTEAEIYVHNGLVLFTLEIDTNNINFL
jgi:hypothetical protein